MIRYESVVTALLGAIGGRRDRARPRDRARCSALEDEGLDARDVPPSLPVIVLVAAILIGVVAAIGPARRASGST